MAARRQLRALHQELDSLAKIERLIEYTPDRSGRKTGRDSGANREIKGRAIKG